LSSIAEPSISQLSWRKRSGDADDPGDFNHDRGMLRLN